MVEDHGDAVRIELAQQLHEHIGEAVDRVHRGAVVPGHWRQAVEGAEDEARAVDQHHMLGAQ